MENLEIEEIIEQDQNGIIFRGRLGPDGDLVAIRRFFPFGKSGGGLEKEDAVAFTIAADRISAVTHPALREVLGGGVDPIDGVPFLVTRWIEGEPLVKHLENGSLNPADVGQLLGIAIEVSIVLSHILGEEAIWVETSVGSIVVGDPLEGQPFTFWMSPFKWLGGDASSRGLTSLVTLGEELTGWKGKLVSDQAGNGLGGWLKWIKEHPEAGLHTALEELSARSGNHAPPTEEALVAAAARTPVKPLRHARTFSPFAIVAILLLACAAAILFYLHKTATVESMAAGYSEQPLSPIIDTDPPRPNGQPVLPASPTTSGPTPETVPPAPLSYTSPEPDPAPVDHVNALAGKLAAKSAAESERLATLEALQSEAIESRNGTYLPTDTELLSNLKRNTDVRVKGKLLSLGKSNSGKSIYLEFAASRDPSLIAGVLHQGDYRDTFNQSEFADLIGREIVVSGKYITQGGRTFVKILNRSHVEPVSP